jgi:hypothetical protein
MICVIYGDPLLGTLAYLCKRHLTRIDKNQPRKRTRLATTLVFFFFAAVPRITNIFFRALKLKDLAVNFISYAARSP